MGHAQARAVSHECESRVAHPATRLTTDVHDGLWLLRGGDRGCRSRNNRSSVLAPLQHIFSSSPRQHHLNLVRLNCQQRCGPTVDEAQALIMSAQAPAPTPRVPSEDIISQKTDLCLSNAILKTGIGFSVGVVASVILFRRRAFPVWLGTGFGAGQGYTDCQRSFSPVAVPGVRVVQDGTSSGISSAPATTLERLSQRAGEALSVAKKEGSQKFGELKQSAEAAKDKANDKTSTRGPLINSALELHEAQPSGARASTGSVQDCQPCRLTGTLTLLVLGAYAFKEAHVQGAFKGQGTIRAEHAADGKTRLPRLPGLRGFALSLFGVSAWAAAAYRYSI
ncbi:DUF543-domain-containing protein [Ceraceosorus guamensis]|uniref:MICOS complex subunit MIC10 n=1 Tax=Ceraceosorus guamensis TaxID=1522189 RepID=A0A316VPE0_9BASI|nr:DUF543-domain-containing protein [Ceraceosorus guamensis]PWN39437.1 DUF543-domain-containing protein [Ceraceosorus guamensis]